MSKKSLLPPLPRAEQKQHSDDRLVNLLLSAIINAHPHHDPAEKTEVRLAKVREALFGEPLARGRKSIKDDLKLFPVFEDALRREKEQMQRIMFTAQDDDTQRQWQEQFNNPDLSETGIAKKHAPDFMRQEVQPQSTIDFLRKILGGLSITSADMADLEGLIFGNSPKAERLQRILTDLAAIGIHSKSPFRTEMDDLNPDTD